MRGSHTLLTIEFFILQRAVNYNFHICIAQSRIFSRKALRKYFSTCGSSACFKGFYFTKFPQKFTPNFSFYEMCGNAMRGTFQQSPHIYSKNRLWKLWTSVTQKLDKFLEILNVYNEILEISTKKNPRNRRRGTNPILIERVTKDET